VRLGFNRQLDCGVDIPLRLGQARIFYRDIIV
jgi:hypothetical protein